MNIGAIIQARTGSTRLPNKVLKYLPYNSNITVLEQDIRRVKRSKYLNDIIICTTNNSEDDKIITICEKENVKSFRGSEKDVLSRYYLAAKENKIDVIVRITSDCPCVDANIIDMVIKEYLNDTSYDFVATVLERTFPIGLDVEVIKFSALEKAYFEAQEDYQREHVSDYIYENDGIFKLKNIYAPNKLNNPNIRVTLDTKEDYTLLCAIYDYLYKIDNYFSSEDIVQLLQNKPWILNINSNCVQKKDKYNLSEEIMDAIKILDIQGMPRAKDILIKSLSERK